MTTPDTHASAALEALTEALATIRDTHGPHAAQAATLAIAQLTARRLMAQGDELEAKHVTDLADGLVQSFEAFNRRGVAEA